MSGAFIVPVRVVVQRVSRASVTSAGRVLGEIDAGLVVLVAVAKGDTGGDADLLADKVAHLRVFSDEAGRMNRSVIESGGEILLISQFTLLADVRKGRRPAFDLAAGAELAAPLIDRVASRLRATGLKVATGSFGAKMLVEIHNDGPVTIVFDVFEGRVKGSG